MRGGRRARRASRPAACDPQRARRALRSLAAAVGRARVGGDEEGDVVVAAVELDLDADAAKKRGGRPEEKAVDAGLEARCEVGDPAVAVRLAGRDELDLPELH